MILYSTWYCTSILGSWNYHRFCDTWSQLINYCIIANPQWIDISDTGRSSENALEDALMVTTTSHQVRWRCMALPRGDGVETSRGFKVIGASWMRYVCALNFDKNFSINLICICFYVLLIMCEFWVAPSLMLDQNWWSFKMALLEHHLVLNMSIWPYGCVWI